jgi:Neuraminidase (sialidase)
VSFDAVGRAYQIGLPIVDGSLSGPSAISTSYSIDGGQSWTTPVDIKTVDDPTGLDFLDKESITADPYHAGRAWATWIEGNLRGENVSFNKLVHAFDYRGTPMVSRTTDGGDTWSTPKPMTGMQGYFQGNQIVAEPDGTLVNVFAALWKGSGVQPHGGGAFVGVMRSTNAGKTWSTPRKIAPLGTVATSADGHDLRVGDYLPDLAVDPNSGALYITWADGLGSSPNKIAFSSSADGGNHWTTPVAVSTHSGVPAFNHAVTVANDGTVAVLYMDTSRNNDATTADGIPTDVYVRSSSDGGVTWGDPQVIDSFDFANAPDTERGYFLGDYEGLTAIDAHDLLAFVGVAGSSANSADVHSIRLRG